MAVFKNIRGCLSQNLPGNFNPKDQTGINWVERSKLIAGSKSFGLLVIGLVSKSHWPQRLNFYAHPGAEDGMMSCVELV